MRPVAILHKRQRERGDEDDKRTEIRNDRQKYRHETQQERVVHADDEEADGVKHGIAHRHQHLAAKEGDEVLLIESSTKTNFFLRRRIAHGRYSFQ